MKKNTNDEFDLAPKKGKKPTRQCYACPREAANKCVECGKDLCYNHTFRKRPDNHIVCFSCLFFPKTKE